MCKVHVNNRVIPSHGPASPCTAQVGDIPQVLNRLFSQSSQERQEEQDQDRVTETLRDQEKTAKRQGEESPMIEELRRAGLVVERLRASEEEGSLPPPLFDRPAAGPSTPSAILLPGNADRPPLLSLSALPPQQPKTITVPTGHVWLSGDNLANSTDSRNYGPVPLGCLRGKILMRVSSSFSC